MSRRYPAYRDSGVDWLGEVPAHWEVRPLKHLASFMSGGTPSKDRLDYWDGDIPWISAKDLKSELLDTAQLQITQDAVDQGAATVAPAASVVVLVRGMTLAHSFPVCQLRREMAINQDLKALMAKNGMSAEFLPVVLRAASKAVHSMIDEAGHGTKVLRMDVFGNLGVPVPSLPEQHAITAVLDREVGKIDALVEEQRRLIALLAEKRRAVISHAVTRGLNPNVPLKPSGVDWLGDIPAHWEVGPLKRWWAVIDCKHVTAEFVVDGIPVVSIGEVQAEFVDLSKAKMTTDAFYQVLIEGNRRPCPGDIVYSRNATVGMAAKVHDALPKAALGQDVCLMRANSFELDYRFLYLNLISDQVKFQIGFYTVGSTFYRINVSDIRSFTVPLPPLDEQAAIVAHIDAQTARLDALSAEAERAVSLLLERRAALISAAVTGKIDVREAVDATEAA